VSETVNTSWSDYLAWLTITVPGWLVKGNIDAIGYALANLPADSHSIVEIGSFCGLSACALCYLRDKQGLKSPLYTCDSWDFESLLWLEDQNPFFDHQALTYREFKDFVRVSFVRNVLTFCQPNLPRSFEMPSDSFFHHWRMIDRATDVLGHERDLGGLISFCYIDGNHTYPFVRRDFENTDPFLVPGGFILFDDSHKDTEWPDVRKVALEVQACDRYELVSENPNYLFRKILTAQ
jgi:hypothetical protein